MSYFDNVYGSWSFILIYFTCIEPHDIALKQNFECVVHLDNTVQYFLWLLYFSTE